jgi:hypothetical protein
MVKRLNGYRFLYTDRDLFDEVILLLQQKGIVTFEEIHKVFPRKSRYLFDEVSYLVDKLKNSKIGGGYALKNDQSDLISNLLHPAERRRTYWRIEKV